MQTACTVLIDYADQIPEEKKEVYTSLVKKMEIEDNGIEKQAVFDLVPFFHQKE